MTVIDETYNSNPEALKRTLEWVDQEYAGLGGGQKIAVLGDMLELGDNETQYHKDVGQFFAGLGFDHLVTVGERARHIADGAKENGFGQKKIRCFDGSHEAGVYLRESVPEGSVVLFKASRGIRMENAVKELTAVAPVKDKEKENK